MSKKHSSIVVRPFIFLSKWRSLPPFEMASYVLMYASIPMLAYGIHPYNLDIIKLIILTILTMYSGFFAALIWNDITDKDIDTVVHPDRPIPSGKISSKKFFAVALLFSAMTFIFSILVSFWCFIVVICAALFVSIHDKYLKKIVNFPAYSEIFTPVQWVVVAIFGFLAIWTALPPNGEVLLTVSVFGNISFDWYDLQNMILLVLFTYFADNAHDLPEGIHDANGDRKLGVKTYATSFGEKNAARISFVMFLISGMLGIVIYLRTALGFIFLIPFVCIWIYTLFYSFKLLKANDNEINELSAVVGRKGFNYFIFTYDFIFIDILVQLVLLNFK